MDRHWDELDNLVARAESSGCTVGIAILFPDGSEYMHNSEEIALAASTIKMAVMVSIFQHIESGELSLHHSIRLEPTHKIPGAGIIQGLHDGTPLTVGDLLYLMISISDNPATNLLINLVGIDAVNATMRGVGMERSKLVRLMEGRDARGFENENLAVPAEFADLCKKITESTAATPRTCEYMTELLMKQQNTRRIGRYVSNNPSLVWGSKTGTSRGLVNDVGFVRGPSGTIVFSLFASGFEDILDGEQFIADLALSGMRIAGFV